MSIYIGKNNTAKKVKNIYVGVDNIAKKVKTSYIIKNENIFPFKYYYTKLEYIKANNGAYIDTEILFNENYAITLNMALNELPGSTTNGTLLEIDDLIFSTYLRTNMTYPYINGDSFGLLMGTNNYHKIDLNFQKKYYICDSDTVRQITKEFTFNNENPVSLLLLGYRHNNQSFSQPYINLKNTIIYQNIEEGMNKINEFVPCKRSDGIIGMYDIINSKFYQNASGNGYITGGSETSTIYYD